MSVFRINKNKNYTTMSNYHLQDKNLSYKAKGLLSVMLSLPENWDYSVSGLCNISLEGKDAVRSTLKELENAKYLVRTRVQCKNGRFDYDYDIYETPCSENPYTEARCAENPTQLNTNKQNTNKQNTKNYIYGQFEEFYGQYPKKVQKQNVQKWFEKNKPNEELFETIMNKLKAFKNSPDWLKDNGQYIPYPTTWLNQKRWEDDLQVDTQTFNNNDDYKVCTMTEEEYFEKLEREGRRYV